MREETFAAVVPFAKFETLDEAIALANDTDYGLVAYAFTRDYATTVKLTEALEAGTVCVNHGAVNTNYAPYAGWKDSGYGVELGRRAVFEYLKPKHVKIALLSMLLDPIQSRARFADALARGYAILAVNADSPAAVTDCLEAARHARRRSSSKPACGSSPGAVSATGDPVLGLARYLADLTALAGSERYREVPVIFHTDHIKGPDTLRILAAAIRGVPQRALARSRSIHRS